MTQAPSSGAVTPDVAMNAVPAAPGGRLPTSVPFWFGADAIVTGANAIGYLALAAPLVAVLGAGAGTLRVAGAFLAVFAIYVGAIALRSRRSAAPAAAAWTAVLVNAAWVVGSTVVALTGIGDFSSLGRVWLVAQAAAVGVIALMQTRALRRG